VQASYLDIPKVREHQSTRLHLMQMSAVMNLDPSGQEVITAIVSAFEDVNFLLEELSSLQEKADRLTAEIRRLVEARAVSPPEGSGVEQCRDRVSEPYSIFSLGDK